MPLRSLNGGTVPAWAEASPEPMLVVKASFFPRRWLERQRAAEAPGKGLLLFLAGPVDK